MEAKGMEKLATLSPDVQRIVKAAQTYVREQESKHDVLTGNANAFEQALAGASLEWWRR